MKALTRRTLRAARVERRPDDHKGTFGHVLVVAGSQGMAGAAILTAKAALRSGAGLVTLAVPASLQAVVAGQVPEAMTLGLPETSFGTFRSESAEQLGNELQAHRYTAMALGPGLSTNSETAQFVLKVLSGLALPAVIDADALNILAAQEKDGVCRMMATRGQGAILTPHPGEMARCLDRDKRSVQKGRAGCAVELARRWNAVALLKGRSSLISDGKRTVVNATGGAGLARGGTGDLLTGLIAGLWAQMIASDRVKKDAAFLAAGLGAHLHGLAGDLAAKKHTPWAMTALDVLENFSGAFKRL